MGSLLRHEVVRFVVVGGLNTFWCLLILTLLREQLRLELWIASSVAYGLATLHSFLLNKFWTFRGPQTMRASAQLTGFIALNVFNFLLFNFTTAKLEAAMGVTLAGLVGTGLVICITFAVSKFFLFRD